MEAMKILINALRARGANGALMKWQPAYRAVSLAHAADTESPRHMKEHLWRMGAENAVGDALIAMKMLITSLTVSSARWENGPTTKAAIPSASLVQLDRSKIEEAP